MGSFLSNLEMLESGNDLWSLYNLMLKLKNNSASHAEVFALCIQFIVPSSFYSGTVWNVLSPILLNFQNSYDDNKPKFIPIRWGFLFHVKIEKLCVGTAQVLFGGVCDLYYITITWFQGLIILLCSHNQSEFRTPPS